MKFKLALAAVAAATISSPALADTCDFSLNGRPYPSLTFSVDCSPTTHSTENGRIDFYGLPSIVGGVPVENIIFFGSGGSSTLAFNGSGPGETYRAYGPQLYSGTIEAPTFIPGIYALEFDTTLTISSAAAVPEPATWAMMLLGFGAIGVTSRRRRKAMPAAV